MGQVWPRLSGAHRLPGKTEMFVGNQCSLCVTVTHSGDSVSRAGVASWRGEFSKPTLKILRVSDQGRSGGFKRYSWFRTGQAPWPVRGEWVCVAHPCRKVSSISGVLLPPSRHWVTKNVSQQFSTCPVSDHRSVEGVVEVCFPGGSLCLCGTC